MNLFGKDGDFDAFERSIEKTLESCPMRICADCPITGISSFGRSATANWRRSFRTHFRAPSHSLGCTLGWYALPRWGRKYFTILNTNENKRYQEQGMWIMRHGRGNPDTELCQSLNHRATSRLYPLRWTPLRCVRSVVAENATIIGLPSRSRGFRVGLVPRHGYELLSTVIDASKNCR